MKFSKSQVEYASHQLSLYYGPCPHNCLYCFLEIYRKRNWGWAVGSHRLNPKVFELAKKANGEGVDCLVVSFTNDPIPKSNSTQDWHNKLTILIKLLNMLEEREIPTKVLTKNGGVWGIVDRTEPYKHIQIGLSVTTNMENFLIQQHWEPNSSPISGRLGALRILRRRGFRTWVSAEPILPQTVLLSFFAEIFGVRPEEVWFGKGSYHQELENAFDWGEVANVIGKMTIPGVHMKKELLENRTQSGSLEEYLCR